MSTVWFAKLCKGSAAKGNARSRVCQVRAGSGSKGDPRKEERQQKAALGKRDGHREIDAHVQEEKSRGPGPGERGAKRRQQREKLQADRRRERGPRQVGVVDDPGAEETGGMGFEEALGDDGTESAGSEGVGLAVGLAARQATPTLATPLMV